MTKREKIELIGVVCTLIGEHLHDHHKGQVERREIDIARWQSDVSEKIRLKISTKEWKKTIDNLTKELP